MRDNIGKCRGQRKDNGELVYGSLFQCKYSKKAYIVLNEYSADELMQHKLFYSRFAWHEVIPETVGQSTGLKDKNGAGQEIYDGDLIGTPNGIVCQVVYRELYGQWWTKFRNTSHKSQWDKPLFEVAGNSYLKVIGTIHSG